MPTLRLVASTLPVEPVETAVLVRPLTPLFDDFEWLDGLDHSGLRALVRETAFAVASLSVGDCHRVVVPTEAAMRSRGGATMKGAVWELGLVRDGSDLLISVFTSGSRARIVQSGRRVAIEVVHDALLLAIATCDAMTTEPSDVPESGIVEMDGVRPQDRGLAIAHDKLVAARSARELQPPSTPPWMEVRVEMPQGEPLRISAEFPMQEHGLKVGAAVRRSDLHALLYRGVVQFERGASAQQLNDVHVFVLAEQFLHLVADAMETLTLGRGLVERRRVGDLSCGIELDQRGTANLVIAHAHAADGPSWRLPPMLLDHLAAAALTFGMALHREILAHDPSQQSNLRLDSFQESLGLLRNRLGATRPPEPLLNGQPESYRAFAESDGQSRHTNDDGRGLSDPQPVPPASQASKLRFSESWRAVVPGIDLRSLYLCGDRLIVGCARELACIARTNGQLIWRRRARRAVTIMTPVGVARLGADGLLRIHDIDDGEVDLEMQLGPCVGGTASGAVVNSPGLPHMLLVTEGADQLAAIDLDSGEIRWRRSIPSDDQGVRRGHTRLRRAGKLVIITDSSHDLCALDLLSGEVVWRQRAAECFRHGVTLDGVDLFAVTTNGARGAATLHRYEPWTGAELWRAPLPQDYRVAGPPRAARSTIVTMVDERSSQGEVLRSGIVAFDRDTGALKYDMSGGLCVGAAASLMVDDLLVASGERGELVGIEIDDGSTRFRHVFAPQAADVPTSLQPVLRSGALFVPQNEVYVVRPRDGAVIGRVATDLVPDCIRVDERCGVYVAELSGYVAAYHALPMLTLVSPT